MPDSTKRPLKVFLCHAHADRDAVSALYSRLRREGIDVWLDKKKLLAGSDWELEIRKAVREADVVVVCLSKQFNQAGFRQKEVRIALDTAMEQPEGEIFIIPARLEECENLENLRKWHWVDLFEADGYRKLIRALRVRADRIGATLRIRRSVQSSISRPKNTVLEQTNDVPVSSIGVNEGLIDIEMHPTPRQAETEREGVEKTELEKAEQEKFEHEASTTADREIIEQALNGRTERFATKKASSESEATSIEEKPKTEEQISDESPVEQNETLSELVVEKDDLDSIQYFPLPESAKAKAEEKQKTPIVSPPEVFSSNELLPQETSKDQNDNVLPSDLTAKRRITSNPKLRLFIRVASLIIFVPLCIMIGVNYSINNLFEFATITVTSSPTNVVSTRPASQPTTTNTHVPTQTAIPPTPTLGIGLTMISDKDGMTLLYVSAGKFTMGSNNGSEDEKPVHLVYLGAFWIDKTEVTNAMYAKCVHDGKCRQPGDTYRYDNSNYVNHPVFGISWNDAKAYCEWADRRLPTEAEWEKAARGTDQRTYPWGNDPPNDNLLNYYSNVFDTTEVGKYPDGASPYGALDMAGNVWEWVSSLYKPYPYSAIDGREDLNAVGVRALRGGSWSLNGSTARSANRDGNRQSYTDHLIGFRCAMSATP